MLTKLLKKLFMILVALSMFVISVGSWRYQGDVHHMYTQIFKSDKNYQDRLYQTFWKLHSADNYHNTIEMEKIHIYEMFRQVSIEHPSEKMMNHLINSKRWSKFVPNSNSSTYKMSQKIWMSQNITIKELMNHELRGVEEQSLALFNKELKMLNDKEIEQLLLHQHLLNRHDNIPS